MLQSNQPLHLYSTSTVPRPTDSKSPEFCCSSGGAIIQLILEKSTFIFQRLIYDCEFLLNPSLPVRVAFQGRVLTCSLIVLVQNNNEGKRLLSPHTVDKSGNALFEKTEQKHRVKMAELLKNTRICQVLEVMSLLLIHLRVNRHYCGFLDKKKFLK